MTTTKAQQKAVAKYKKENYSRIPLDVPKVYHEYIKERAKQDGQTVNAWIKQAMEERAQNVSEEIPPKVITNLMEWLREHGHNAEQITDCLNSLSNE